MQNADVLDLLPTWAVFCATLLLVLLSLEIGFLIGRFRNRRSDVEKEAPVGSMVGATLALLAFMLGFAFSMAADRYDARRHVLLDEVNSIGTTYLRAGLFPQQRDAIRELLREYVDIRLEAARTGKINEGIRRSEELQAKLWAQAEALGQQHPDSITVGLFIQSLNETIDLHTKRVTASLRSRVPDAIWLTLFAVAAVSFSAMGYHAGLSRTHRSIAALAVAFVFASVIGMIVALDRPTNGILRISQQGLIDLRQSMR